MEGACLVLIADYLNVKYGFLKDTAGSRPENNIVSNITNYSCLITEENNTLVGQWTSSIRSKCG